MCAPRSKPLYEKTTPIQVWLLVWGAKRREEKHGKEVLGKPVHKRRPAYGWQNVTVPRKWATGHSTRTRWHGNSLRGKLWEKPASGLVITIGNAPNCTVYTHKRSPFDLSARTTIASTRQAMAAEEEAICGARRIAEMVPFSGTFIVCNKFKIAPLHSGR